MVGAGVSTQAPAPTSAALVPLLAAIGDLKRTRASGRDGSVADRSFLRAWGALAAGAEPAEVARREVARALVATRLGAIDAEVLRAGGVDDAGIATIARRALSEVIAEARPWADAIEALVGPIEAIDHAALDDTAAVPAPAFAVALAHQPRAGAAVPGRPRVIVEPAEDHAEHCVTVAVYAALVAGPEGADPGTAFLAGMSHHLHNAELPDAGFLGESMLGDQLEVVMTGLTERALAELPRSVADATRAARRSIVDAATPEGRAFHTADVVDRVLQARHHARAAAFTLEQALDEMDLVHEGPLQRYHLGVLAEAGLWP